MPATAHVRCATCGKTTVVFPTELRSLIPEWAQPGLTAALSSLEDSDGLYFALADQTGHFNCPVCATEGYTPQIHLH